MLKIDPKYNLLYNKTKISANAINLPIILLKDHLEEIKLDKDI